VSNTHNTARTKFAAANVVSYAYRQFGSVIRAAFRPLQVDTKVSPAMVEYFCRVVAGLIAPRVFAKIVFTSTGA
jgi:hypothetical protein